MDAARNPPPDFVIIGMPRASTTSLYETLSKHPQLSPSRRKETNYFARDLSQEQVEQKIKQGYRTVKPLSRTAYRALFKDAKADQLRFEASASYIYSRTAPHAILEENPRCKALLVLREPTSWVASYYQHLKREYREDLPIEEAYERSKQGTRTSYPRYRKQHSVYHYYQRAVPTKLVAEWKEAFGDQLMITTMRHVQNEWPEFRAELAAFLGIEDRPIELVHSSASSEPRLPLPAMRLLNSIPMERRTRLPLYPRLSKLYRRRGLKPTTREPWRPPKSDFAERVREMETITGLPLMETWGYDKL